MFYAKNHILKAASRALSHAEARVLGESSAVSMEVWTCFDFLLEGAVLCDGFFFMDSNIILERPQNVRYFALT